MGRMRRLEMSAMEEKTMNAIVKERTRETKKTKVMMEERRGRCDGRMVEVSVN